MPLPRPSRSWPSHVRALRLAAVVALLAPVAACGRADRSLVQDDAKAGAPARTLPLGTYTLRSASRFAGATLRYYDAGYGGSPSGELTLPGDAGRYTGSISSRGPDTVAIALACRCRVGVDANGLPRYDDVAYVGRYAIRALGGDRYELRRADGETPAADTLEARR